MIGLLNLVSFGLIGKARHETTRTVDLGFQRTELFRSQHAKSQRPRRLSLPAGRQNRRGRKVRHAIAIVEGGVLQEPLIVLPALTGVGKASAESRSIQTSEHNGYLYVAYTTLDNRDRLFASPSPMDRSIRHRNSF